MPNEVVAGGWGGGQGGGGDLVWVGQLYVPGRMSVINSSAPARSCVRTGTMPEGLGISRSLGLPVLVLHYNPLSLLGTPPPFL